MPALSGLKLTFDIHVKNMIVSGCSESELSQVLVNLCRTEQTKDIGLPVLTLVYPRIDCDATDIYL